MHVPLLNEERHLSQRPLPDEVPAGLGTKRILAWCSNNAKAVLQRSKDVLAIVNRQSSQSWPSEAIWETLLPCWFLQRCIADPSPSEAEAEMARLAAMSPEEQVHAVKTAAWSLTKWLYFFEPVNRQWYWWHGEVIYPDLVVLAIEVHDWPYHHGALDWLLRAAGADRVEDEG